MSDVTSYLHLSTHTFHDTKALTKLISNDSLTCDETFDTFQYRKYCILISGAEAKGVAGIGRAQGGGSVLGDGEIQEVPAEVYEALKWTAAGFAGICSLPCWLYAFNKLLNVVEWLFCGRQANPCVWKCGAIPQPDNKLEKTSSIENNNGAAGQQLNRNLSVMVNMNGGIEVRRSRGPPPPHVQQQQQQQRHHQYSSFSSIPPPLNLSLSNGQK